MKIGWCWACRREHPMLDDQEFDAVRRDFRAALEAESARQRAHAGDGNVGGTLRERLLNLQEPPPSAAALPSGVTSRQLLYRPLQDAYERITGLSFEGDDPKVILHYRLSFYGPPCPHCGRLIRNAGARQCYECGMDWHDPAHPVCRRKG